MEEGTRTRLAVAAAVAVLVAGAAVALVLFTGDDEPGAFARGSVPPPQLKKLPAAAQRAGCAVERHAKEGDGTTAEPVTYRSNPPHSGRHAPEPARDGAYYARGPATEAMVHALRHGRIAIWFDPEMEETDKGRLKALFDEDPPHMILVPREDMPQPVAASAWRTTLTCPSLRSTTFDALRAFKVRFRDQGPEFVP